MAAIATIIALVPIILVEYQEVLIINELNNYFNFDHNIFFIDSSVDTNRFISRHQAIPRSLYVFDSTTGLGNQTDIKSKNTFLVVVPANSRFEYILNLLNGIVKIQSHQTNVKFGIFFPHFISRDDMQFFFEWCKEQVIVNIFAAAYLQPEVNPVESSPKYLLNIFTYHPFKTLDVINVTGSYSYDSYFPSLDSNFHQHQLKLGEGELIASYDYDVKLFLVIFAKMNASFVLEPDSPDDWSEAELLENRSDIITHTYRMYEATGYYAYPLLTETVLMIIPEPLPYPAFSAYLLNLTSDWLYCYSIITISTVVLLLTVIRYINQKKILFYQSVTDVLSLLLNDNGYIKYQRLHIGEIYLIVPLTFMGLVFVNGMLSTLKSYLTQPILQPKINTVEELYTSPISIVTFEKHDKVALMNWLSNQSEQSGDKDWNEKIILWSGKFEFRQIYNQSLARIQAYDMVEMLLGAQGRMKIRGFYNPKFELSTNFISHEIHPKLRFIERFNEIIHRIQSTGIYMKWVHWSRRRREDDIIKLNVELIGKQNFDRLGNDNLVENFEFPMVIVYGWITSIIVFIIEIIWSNFTFLWIRTILRFIVRKSRWGNH